MNITKPDGFDLRDKRSERKKDASQWLPADALYDASQAVSKQDATPDALLVVWRERHSDGTSRLQWRYAGKPDGAAALVTRFIKES